MATHYVLDLMPRTPVEHTLFSEIVRAAWQLARVSRMETEACAGKSTYTEMLDDEGWKRSSTVSRGITLESRVPSTDRSANPPRLAEIGRDFDRMESRIAKATPNRAQSGLMHPPKTGPAPLRLLHCLLRRNET